MVQSLIVEDKNKLIGQPDTLVSSPYRFGLGVVLLFLFIYTPIHRTTSISFGLIPVIFGFIMVLANKRLALKLFFLPRSIEIVFLFSLGATLGLLSILVMDGSDYYLPLLMAKGVAIYFPVSIGLILYICGDRTVRCLDKVVRLLFLAIAVQGFIIISQFLFPEFNIWTSSFILAQVNLNSIHEFKFGGISNAGGAGLSLIQGLGIFLGSYCAHIERNSTYRSLYLLGLWILFLSATLAGRTGVVVGAVALLVSFFFSGNRRLFFSHILLLSGLTIIISLVFPYFFQERADFYANVSLSYAFEPIMNYSQGQGLSSGSVTELSTMLYIPDNISYVLFGVGAFDVPGKGLMQTDSGYLKTLFSSGLFGVFVIYGAFALMFAKILFSLNKTGRYAFLFAILCLVVAEVKEPFLYQNAVARCLWILFAAALYDHLQNRRLFKYCVQNSH